MHNKIQNPAILLVLLILLSSCGPIHRFTRMKKTPREYSLNYCGDELQAPKTDLNRKVWIVFSDRENNPTYQNPGGKVKLKEMSFLEPFVVIKEKGDFLQLVKYDASIIDDNLLTTKFKDRKKAEYYGWVEKSKLLLTRQSVTDIASGFKNKEVTILSDTVPLRDPDLYFAKDSVRLFKDVNLTIDNQKTSLYEIIYTLKISPDRQKKLVAKKTEITPDSAHAEVLGWVHTSLVEDIGQRLHIDPNSISRNNFHFENRERYDTICISDYSYDESENIAKRRTSLKYSPVRSWSVNNEESRISMKTAVPLPILDQRDNYVFNVDGGKISYSAFKRLEKELKNINLVFVFEGKNEIINNYPALVNVVQNLQPLFENKEDNFNYNFGSVLSVQSKESASGNAAPVIRHKELTSDYSEFIDYLVWETENVKNFVPLSNAQTWSGVRAAAEMIKDRKDDTNLLVIIGESGYSEAVDTLLLNKISNLNSRVLGFQMHGEVNNPSNNFVLQIENMINYYAHKKMTSKRKVIVYPNQLRKVNRYAESSKNIYKLDFPDRSMTQGWILFPEKDSNMPLDMLTSSIDSVLTEIKWDNDNIVNSLYRAFGAVGNHRYKYDSLFVDYHRISKPLDRKLPTYFSEVPSWYMPSDHVSIPDSLASTVKYRLLLSKDELGELNLFLEQLYANEVDYKYNAKKNKSRKICNCPDDDEYFLSKVKITSDSVNAPEYMSTGKIRKKLEKLYLSELKTCKVCKTDTKALKRLTLAEAQRKITGCPTYNPMLERFTINDIRKKNRMSDYELDMLITYIKEKKESLDKYLHKAEKFVSNGEEYFWIDQRLLP